MLAIDLRAHGYTHTTDETDLVRRLPLTPPRRATTTRLVSEAMRCHLLLVLQSASVMVNDVVAVLNTLFPGAAATTTPPAAAIAASSAAAKGVAPSASGANSTSKPGKAGRAIPPLVFVGHSMGGALASRLANIKTVHCPVAWRCARVDGC